MHTTIHVRERIAASPEVIFAILSNHEGYARFPGFISSKLVRRGAEHENGVGARRVMWFNGVRVVEDIVQFEPPKKLGYRVVHCSIPMRHELGVVEITPGPYGSVVSWSTAFDVDVPVIGKLIARVTEPGLTDAIRKILRHVKREAEQREDAPMHASRSFEANASATV